jgi:DnaJ-domain-containing protein 1
MKIYQKIILSCTLMLGISAMSNALDTDGVNVINSLKSSYINNFMPDKVLVDNLGDLQMWKTAIDFLVAEYVTKNGTVAGITDSLLEKTLALLKGANTKLVMNINKIKKNNSDRDALQALQNLKQSILDTEGPLKKEPYYISSKKNAQEVLLTALEFIRGATETAIDQARKPSRETIPTKIFDEFPQAKNITDKREKAFAILGVPSNASPAEIKKAYTKLALKWHPDRWVGASADEKKYASLVFQIVVDAYDFVK